MHVPRLMQRSLSTASHGDKALFRRPHSSVNGASPLSQLMELEMKPITAALAASALLALAACNQQEAGNNAAAANTVDANAAATGNSTDGAKPAGEAGATGNEAAAPAGDKPAPDTANEAGAEGEAPAGDKPTQ